MRVVAALYVDPRGCYRDRTDIDLWSPDRDARLYRGPHPVVAHPPCTRWCQLAGLVQARYGYKVGEDDGCFAAAIASVREFGGVLEHPAYSKAWPAFNLPKPPRAGGWIPTPCGGHTCHVEQGRYGHPARKATWLYAFNAATPELLWGPSQGKALVSWCRNHVQATETRRRVGKRAAAATPPAFRDALIDIAASVTDGQVIPVPQ